MSKRQNAHGAKKLATAVCVSEMTSKVPLAGMPCHERASKKATSALTPRHRLDEAEREIDTCSGGMQGVV